jgi:hypothetical protein
VGPDTLTVEGGAMSSKRAKRQREGQAKLDKQQKGKKGNKA